MHCKALIGHHEVIATLGWVALRPATSSDMRRCRDVVLTCSQTTSPGQFHLSTELWWVRGEMAHHLITFATIDDVITNPYFSVYPRSRVMKG